MLYSLSHLVGLQKYIEYLDLSLNLKMPIKLFLFLGNLT